MREKIVLKSCLALLCMLGLSMPAWAHEFHTSITDARYNPKKHTYELAIRVFADDLEEALSLRHKTVVRLDRSEKVNKLVADYLQANLAVSGSKGVRGTQKFIGMQEESDAVWLYVEIPADGVPAGQVWVQNALLMELFNDQMNIMNLQVGSKKRSVLFKPGDSQHVIAL